MQKKPARAPHPVARALIEAWRRDGTAIGSSALPDGAVVTRSEWLQVVAPRAQWLAEQNDPERVRTGWAVVPVAALDAQHTKELNDEKAKLEKLRADVAAGRVGLRVNATCTPAAGTGVPSAASATSVADATSPRLTDAAERSYFDLRTGIETARQQIAGLQDYIRGVCLK